MSKVEEAKTMTIEMGEAMLSACQLLTEQFMEFDGGMIIQNTHSLDVAIDLAEHIAKTLRALRDIGKDFSWM